MPPDFEDKRQVIELLRGRPLERGQAARAAQELDPTRVRLFLDEIQSELGVDSATLAAFAVLTQGIKPGDERLLRLLPEVDHLHHFDALLCHGAEDLVVLVQSLLQQGRMSAPRKALAVLRAAEALGEATPPAALLASLRRQLRSARAVEDGIHLGRAAELMGDPFTRELGQAWIDASRRLKGKTLPPPPSDPLLVLSERIPKLVVSGYTMQRQTPDVGRNDPCPCGSGRKYKKCCMGSEEQRPGPSPIPQPQPHQLSERQINELRPALLEQLNPATLNADQLITVHRRLVDFAHWEAAESFLDAFVSRAEPDFADGHRFDFVDALLRADQLELAERQCAKLTPEAQDDLHLRFVCARRKSGLLEQLEAEARRGLLPGGQGVLVDLAYLLLQYSPALGILAARAALCEERLLDSDMLLRTAEDARDAAALPPFEPWWDIWDLVLEHRVEKENAHVQHVASAGSSTRSEQTLTELKATSAQVGQLKTELGALEVQLKELVGERDALARAANPEQLHHAQAQSRELETERRRLRTKVEELRGLLGQSQRERAELRKRVAQVIEAVPQSPLGSAPQTPIAEASPENADEALAGLEFAGGSDFVPRRLLIPEYAARARRALQELPSNVGQAALQTVGELSAGKEGAWAQLRHLRAVTGVRSARIGIHHRLLVRVQAPILHVLDIVSREDLETTIAHLR